MIRVTDEVLPPFQLAVSGVLFERISASVTVGASQHETPSRSFGTLDPSAAMQNSKRVFAPSPSSSVLSGMKYSHDHDIFHQDLKYVASRFPSCEAFRFDMWGFDGPENTLFRIKGPSPSPTLVCECS